MVVHYSVSVRLSNFCSFYLVLFLDVVLVCYSVSKPLSNLCSFSFLICEKIHWCLYIIQFQNCWAIFLHFFLLHICGSIWCDCIDYLCTCVYALFLIWCCSLSTGPRNTKLTVNHHHHRWEKVPTNTASSGVWVWVGSVSAEWDMCLGGSRKHPVTPRGV